MAIKRKEVVEFERTGRKVKRKDNEDSSSERESTIGDLTKAFGAQAVGLLVGGLLGGRDGAIAGGKQGAIAGQALNTVLDSAQTRADKRHDAEFTQDLALDTMAQQDRLKQAQFEIDRAKVANTSKGLEKKDLTTDLINPETGDLLSKDKFGNAYDRDGNLYTGPIRNLQEDKYDQGNKRIDQTVVNQGLARDRLDQGERRLTEQKLNRNETSDKQTERFTDIASSYKGSQRIAELVGKVNVGPVAGRIQALGEVLGYSPSAFTKLRTATGIQLVNFIKKTSGAAVSEPEARRLQGLINSVNDDPKVFQAKLEEFQLGLTDEYDTLASSLYKLQGKKVVGLKDMLSGKADAVARDSAKDEAKLKGLPVEQDDFDDLF